jgi:two-component system KDP operon response regulator KdpE
MLVEGSASLTRTISAKLQAEDYELFSYRRAEEALEELPTIRFDLVIIDTTVANLGGVELTRRIRQMSEVPLILVADKATDAERVQGLNSGADDYITKPISDDELMVRVQLIFKRQYISTRVSEPIVIGDLYIDLARRQVFIANKPVDLTRIEYDLLYHLVINRGQVLTHRQLLEKVWGPDYADETHYLWVNISRLRKKLEAGPCIHTQQGIGYYFDM